MRQGLKGMAEEISHGLVQEIQSTRALNRPTGQSIVELLLEQLTQEVVRKLESSTDVASPEDLETRLRLLETKLETLGLEDSPDETEEEEDEDEDEVDAGGASLPNLKYAKPKYKDIESVLKYIESDDEKGAIKLVIMNFND